MPTSQPPLNSLATRWRACKGHVPPPLVGASVTVVDSDRFDGPSSSRPSAGKIYLFGGRLVSTRRMVNELYALDLATLHWEKIDLDESDVRPPPRYFHSCEVWRGKLIVFGGMGYQTIHATPLEDPAAATSPNSPAKPGSKSEALCVLSEVVAFDLETRKWELDYVPPSTEGGPAPRYAHLSSICGDSLVVIGGQDVANQYVDQINVLDLSKRSWTGSTTFQRQCGSYRSLAVSSPWIVESGSKSQDLVEILAGRRTGSTTPVTSVAQGRPRAGTHSSSTTAGSSLNAVTPSSLSGSASNLSGLAESDTNATSPGAASIGGAASSKEEGQSRSPLTGLQPLSMSRAADVHSSGIYIYSNYNFTDVKRELEVASLADEGAVVELEDRSSHMAGATLPPGLRFPTGVVVGDHLLISGTYLANTAQNFSIWSLYLPKLAWARLDVGPLLQSGSWNRAVHWGARNQLLILGNRDRDLVADYNHRQTNWDHVLVLDLEAWGISQPPPRPMSNEAMEMGLRKLEASVASSSAATALAKQGSRQQYNTSRTTSILDSKSWLASRNDGPHAPLLPTAFGSGGDFEIVCSDGVRLGCDRAVLEARWPWFRARMKRFQKQAKAAAELVMAQRPADGEGDDAVEHRTRYVIARYNASLDDGTAPPSPAHSRSGSNGTALFGRPPVADHSHLPRHLHMSEASPVVLALLQFFYTRSISTPLQRHPAVVASLLILAKLYGLEDTLGMWARHAASVLLSEDLLPEGIAANHLGVGTPMASSPTDTPTGRALSVKAAAALSPEECHRLAVVLYEAAGMAGCEPLQLRALRTVVLLSKHIQRIHFGGSEPASTSRRPSEMSRNATHEGTMSMTPSSSATSPVTLRGHRPTSMAVSGGMPHSPMTPISPASESYDSDRGATTHTGSKAEKLLGIGPGKSNDRRLGPMAEEGVRGSGSFRRLASGSSNVAGAAAPPIAGSSGFLRPDGASTTASTAPMMPSAGRSNTVSRKRFSIFGRGGGGGSSSGATGDNETNGSQSDGGTISRIASASSNGDRAPSLQPPREPSPSSATLTAMTPHSASSFSTSSSYGSRTAPPLGQQLHQPVGAVGLPPPTLSAKELKRLEKLEKKSGKKQALAPTIEWSADSPVNHEDVSSSGGGSSGGGASRYGVASAPKLPATATTATSPDAPPFFSF
ncbi:galactose oxidase [Jaminaea rosea]|uniref:Galactose oxidase n=1 Tax=Jaminaea rosea TaxID=1569628 RepID=A0A316UU31_9BASI|nr:galactose oxidase [Jaminaea rosea]PWN28810.1 galactose oxidase [Jaminaea rosea]